MIFFQSVKKLAISRVLYCNPHDPDRKPVIYLPFTPHMFAKVHVFKLNEKYDISYLTHHELYDYRHKLYSATKGIQYESFSTLFDLTMNNQNRYCRTSKNTII